MGSAWVTQGYLNPITGVFIGDRRHRERRQGQVKTEAEIEVMEPQAKECLQPQGAEQVRMNSPLDTSDGTGHSDTLLLDLWHLAV